MIEIHNITKYYGSNENKFQVLKGLSLDIREKDFVVILGASGSGKSTLLNIITGLERPDEGTDRRPIDPVSQGKRRFHLSTVLSAC